MYLLLLSVASSLTVTGSSQLLSVIVIHRHGDRNPVATYTNDPYKNRSYWPEGLGELTNQGMQRQYNLGLWLRSRYDSFLPAQYRRPDVYVRSTDIDRTLMSAQLTLAGLFPPTGFDRWSEDINWRPIPVHTVPKQFDIELAAGRNCSQYKLLQLQLRRSEVIQEVHQNHQQLMDFLTEKTGDNVTSITKVQMIFDILFMQQMAGKQLPEWTAEVFPDSMKSASIWLYKLPCYTREMARLKVGPLFGLIVSHFRKFTRNSVWSGAKFWILSGHETTLANLMVAMNVFDDEIPFFSSALIFELYRREDMGHYVNIIFKNVTVLREIVLENCEFDCDFDKFVEILAPVTITSLQQWEEECENQSYEEPFDI